MTQAQTDYQFVQRCISNCTNKFQIECIDAMIDLFNIKHSDFNLFSCLTDERNAIMNTIMKTIF